MSRVDDWEYRDWLMYTGIEGITGVLESKDEGVGGLVSLSTASLEKLYRNLRDEDPKEAYKHSFHMTQKRDDKCACGHSHGFIVGSDGLTCFDCGKSG